MNRSERRRLEKQNRIRNENRKLIDAIAQDTENQRVEALMTCFALAMHEDSVSAKNAFYGHSDALTGIWVHG